MKVVVDTIKKAINEKTKDEIILLTYLYIIYLLKCVRAS